MTSSATAQTKWEYQSLTRVSEAAMVEALNQLGQESWELASASHYRDMQGMMAWTAILKRPIGGAAAGQMHPVASAAPIATPPAPKSSAPAKAPVAAEDETDFEVATPAPRPPRPAGGPKPGKLGPAKPRVEISDDFDFELADTAPAAQQTTRQAKPKPAPAGVEENLDFELGETFPAKLKPSVPAARADEGADDTDFDLG